MPEIGEKIRFTPAAWTGFHGLGLLKYGAEEDVLGECVEINEAHCWYRLEYTVHGVTLSECFKYIPEGRTFAAATHRRLSIEGWHMKSGDKTKYQYTCYHPRSRKKE